jgi:hypothetical protein
MRGKELILAEDRASRRAHLRLPKRVRGAERETVRSG